MPARNSLKIYGEDSYYHIYNRGVEKRNIFLDEMDFAVFLSYLKFYLSPVIDDDRNIFPSRRLKNYYGDVEMICYCLMQNHFHLLIKQFSRMAMSNFMRSLSTRYSTYFNRKYHREGFLFQGRYKAVQVHSEQQLVYLSRYIHRNPATSRTVLEVLESYRYSSLAVYLGRMKQSWVKHEVVTSLFSKTNKNLTYSSFVVDGEEPGIIHDLTIDGSTTSRTVLEVG